MSSGGVQHAITSESWEFWLSSRTMAVNLHRVGSGRNCSDPFTRLRNTRVAFHHVTHFLCGVDRGLWQRAHDYVLARIRSKCRCAKRERKHDAYTSDRPAAQATWSTYCFHALIVMQRRISRKIIYRHFKTKIRRHQPTGISVRPKEMLQTKIGKTRL
jgi:hypothetical protein